MANEDTTNTQTETTAANTVVVPVPEPGQALTVTVDAEQIPQLNFDPGTESTQEFVGTDLVFTLDNGAVLTFEDFAASINDGEVTSIMLEDGSIIPIDALIAAWNLEVPETAAGEAVASGGASAYVDDMGDALGGIDKLGTQNPDPFGASALAPVEDEQTPIVAPLIVEPPIVEPINLPPEAANDSYVIPIDPANPTTTIEALRGILSNDFDPDGDPITITNVSALPPALTLNSEDGSLTLQGLVDAYKALSEGEESTPITFEYTISDPSGASDTATVSIVFVGVNDLDDGNESVSTREDTSISGNVLDNVDDPDGPDAATVTDFTFGGTTYAAGETATVEGIGTLTISGTGEFTFNPANDYDGDVPDTTYSVTDGTDTVTSTLAIAITPVNDPPDVNDLPDAANDSYSTGEDTVLSITVPGVLDNDDIGGDGGTLEVVSYDQPTNGSVVLLDDGSFIYTPNANYNNTAETPDTFTYTIRDADGDEDTATVSIVVNPADDLPDAANDSYSTGEDTVLSITVPGVLDNDDIGGDGGTLEVVSYNQPTNGSVVLLDDGSFIYTPNANYNNTAETPDTFTYTIRDADGDEDTATVSIVVNPADDLPDAANDSYSTGEDTVLSITVPGVLDNDDIGGDGGTLEVVSYDQPTNGSVVLLDDGSFIYTPNANYNNTAETPDTFTYTIRDADGDEDTATVSIVVNPADDLPDAANDSYSTGEDTVLSITVPGVLDNDDIGGDGGTLEVVSYDQPTNGSVVLLDDGSFIYTPNANYNNTAETPDTFTYTIRDADGDEDTATVSIVVNPADDLPDAANDSYSTGEDTVLSITVPGVLDNDDIGGDGGTLEVVSYDQPTNGSVVLLDDGSFIYTPNANYNNTAETPDTFTYTIRDADGDEDTATVSIVVNPADDLPDAANDSYSTGEDTVLSITVPGVLDNDDIGGDGGTLEVVSYDQPTNGSVVLLDDGSFIYTPNANYNNTAETPDTFTYTIRDADGDEDTATVSIVVNPADDLPDAANDSYSTGEDTVLSITVPGVLDNDNIGGDGGTLEVVSYDQPTNGSVVLLDDGSFIYTPNANYNNTAETPDTFTYTIRDADGDEDTATVSIVVNPVNDPPTVDDETVNVSEEGLIAFHPNPDSDPADPVDADTTNDTSASGTLAITDIDGGTYTITVDTTENQLTSGGESIRWSGQGSAELVGYIGDEQDPTPIITIKMTDNLGGYTVTLSGPVDHGDDTTEDIKTFNVDVAIDPGDGADSVTATLTVNIEDDSPLVSGTEDATLTYELADSFTGLLGIAYGADGPESPSDLAFINVSDGDPVLDTNTSQLMAEGIGLVYEIDNGILKAVMDSDFSTDPNYDANHVAFQVALDPSGVGSYTVTVVDGLDGSTTIDEVTLALADLMPPKNYQEATFDFGDFVVTAIDTATTNETLQANQGWMGVSNQWIAATESMKFQFDAPQDAITVSIQVKGGATGTGEWTAYLEGNPVTNGSGTFDTTATSVTVEEIGNFDSVVFAPSAESGYAFGIGTLTYTTITETEGFSHTLTFDFSATDDDGDLGVGSFDVTFDAEDVPATQGAPLELQQFSNLLAEEGEVFTFQADQNEPPQKIHDFDPENDVLRFEDVVDVDEDGSLSLQEIDLFTSTVEISLSGKDNVDVTLTLDDGNGTSIKLDGINSGGAFEGHATLNGFLADSPDSINVEFNPDTFAT